MDPNAPLVEKLEALIYDDSPEVSCYAIKSAARLKKEAHIPAIIHKLSNPLTHEDAISALKTYGLSAISILEKYLGESRWDIELRKAVVEVLARIGTQEAASILIEEMDQKTEELDTVIIDALDRIHSEKPDIQFPAKVAQRKTLSIIKKYCQTFIDLQGVKPDKNNVEQRNRLERNLGTHFMNIFKLLGLYYPHEDIVKAYQNLKTGTPNSVAYAIELLDNTLKKDMKNIILPLVEDMPSSERRQKFQKILRNFPEI
jgi:HEAT repeat protein